MTLSIVPSEAHSQQQKPPEKLNSKRPRSSLACIRCRQKKVKCDFIQPACTRCADRGYPCAYAKPPRRVDEPAFERLGSHVDELRWRMQKMQSELLQLKSTVHPPSYGGNPMDDNPATTEVLLAAVGKHNPAQQAQQPVTWKLSLSPSGLCIDTNIATVADLYQVLLNGVSQLNINNDIAIDVFSMDSLRGESRTRRNKAWGQYSKANRTLPSAAVANQQQLPGRRLWEVNDHEARRILQERTQLADETLSQETLNGLMHNCYHRCFLPYQIVDCMIGENPGPLLENSMYAWLSKHGCIYHGIGPVQDPASMGESYFKNARQLLRKCFDVSSPTTIHALLNLYMYQLSSERSSLAYLYIGLAIRMAQDLKFHKKADMSSDIKQRETNKRLWWSAYWLDLCAALESNRPTMVDDKDCDLDYPTKLESEDEETGYRIRFGVHSIQLMKIRKDISKYLPSEQSGQSLLSAISRLENSLTNWLNSLEPELRFDVNDNFNYTGTFLDEACIILNIQYQTTWIMLHKCFLPKQDKVDSPVTLLSLNICTNAANFITKMLSIYATYLSWCQFFYVLDGIIASITIHQLNAASAEKEVAHLAQRNLITTMHVLKRSPLLYMDKVNEIIENIKDSLSPETSQPYTNEHEPEDAQPETAYPHPSDPDKPPFAAASLNVAQTEPGSPLITDNVWLNYTDISMQPFTSSRPHSNPSEGLVTEAVQQSPVPMATSMTHTPQRGERPVSPGASLSVATPLPTLCGDHSYDRSGGSYDPSMSELCQYMKMNTNNELMFQNMQFSVVNASRIGAIEQSRAVDSSGSALLGTTIAFQPTVQPPHTCASPYTSSFDSAYPPMTDVSYPNHFFIDPVSYDAEQQHPYNAEISTETFALGALYMDPSATAATTNGLVVNPLLEIEDGGFSTLQSSTRKRAQREWDEGF
ncbi:Transcriptional activator [Apophysomyces sp. BC1034]|nr:Transcriptional activator [Apophysomyces sp. BC1015]KAG0176279.1 Transcriptional activator [Apophysomyces sp. BC1021]KAG0186692.1 Transcriptional activator [Apophysomyces sp. BC1034]